jgi:hypothetical protein
VSMQVTIKRRVTTTYRIDHQLRISAPEFDKERGLRHWPDMDEAAAKEARSVFDAATGAIRSKAKSEDAPVALSIERRGGEMWAVFSATFTSEN